MSEEKEMTQEEVLEELERVRALNQGLLDDMAREVHPAPIPLDMGQVALIKIETLLDMFVTPDSRAPFELEFESRMNEPLVQLAAALRMSKLKNGQPAQQLILP